jgi:hypothetical protein
MISLLMDIPVGNGPAATGILAAVVSFFFGAAAMAFVAFRLLRRSLRSAFRMAVVIGILVAVVAGGVSIYFLTSRSSGPAVKPAASRTR